MKSATVFAPATVANVAVGFDLLGFPISGVGDTVTVSRVGKAGVRIIEVSGLEKVPMDPLENTATVGLIQLLKAERLDFGFEVSVKKGIPLGSGMGGSAASAVGAVVAANALLEVPLAQAALLKLALFGEERASGASHADNAAACLYGGITLAHPEVVSLPIPVGLSCALVHPHIRLDTRDSRKVLKRDVALEAHVAQSANLAGFVAACFNGDLGLMKHSLHDLIIEPQRAHLIPAFDAVKSAALSNGALGCSISGSGPSCFALAASLEEAQEIASLMAAAFRDGGVNGVDAWACPVGGEGARIVSTQ